MIVKDPSAPEAVPFVVPTTVIETPANGAEVAESRITPVIFCWSCANTVAEQKQVMINKQILNRIPIYIVKVVNKIATPTKNHFRRVKQNRSVISIDNLYYFRELIIKKFSQEIKFSLA